MPCLGFRVSVIEGALSDALTDLKACAEHGDWKWEKRDVDFL